MVFYLIDGRSITKSMGNSDPVSMAEKLTLKYERQLEFAENCRAEAIHNLGRIGMIYSGQLHFDFHEHFDPETMKVGYW